MRILWISNAPWAPSGYGVQTKLFVPRIKSLGHDVALFNFYGHEGGVVQQDGILMYPKGGHPYGQDLQGLHAMHHQSDVMITLIDAWVMEPDKYPPNIAWCPWFPVDHEPISPPVLQKVSQAFLPIAYSRFGQEQLRSRGMDCLFVPHGVDTATMRPIPKAAARERLGWPQGVFVVGMVAANVGYPSRKAFPSSFTAFKQLLEDVPDAKLYVHTSGQRGQRQGLDLHRDAQVLGIYDSVIWADEYRALLGYDDETMAAIYSGMDVLLACSMGEGFGVPILEAQACATPVIAGSWTAMPEVAQVGWLHPKEEAWPSFTYQASYMFEPSARVLAGLLGKAYEARHDDGLAKAARAAALEFDADKVTEEYWLPALEEIQRRLEARERVRRILQGAVA